MRAWFERRYLDLLGSIYVYNEHRGYTAIDRVLEAVQARWPDHAALIAKVAKHRAEELRVVERDDLFERLCRVISLTERRGHRQVEILLRHPTVRRDPMLTKIFRFIERDEPSHWALATSGSASMGVVLQPGGNALWISSFMVNSCS